MLLFLANITQTGLNILFVGYYFQKQIYTCFVALKNYYTGNTYLDKCIVVFNLSMGFVDNGKNVKYHQLHPLMDTVFFNTVVSTAF